MCETVTTGKTTQPRKAPADEERRRLLPSYHYTLKHRWAIKLNFLSGITLLPWLTLLVRHWRSIDWRVYLHRVLFLTFMACLNSFLALFDWLFFSAHVAAQPLHPEPLFILGHPRTGTTHLHNLLANDPRFAFATTFHAGFPSSFLSLEPARGLLSGLLERRRPMDHMALHWDLPAEDEIAVNALTGGESPYLALVFPRLWRSLLRSYLTFGASAAEEDEDKDVASAGDTSGPRVTAAFQRWLAAFMWFMKKVTYRHVRNRAADRNPGSGSNGTADPAAAPGAPPPPPPLLIKSPVHTARLRTWLRLFPRARFVYVHRHPLEVFQSAANMADTYYWYTYLQRPTNTDTNDFIMDQYDILYRSYMADREHVPAGRLVEVSFSDLDSDPLAVLQRIYKQFGWDEQFDAVRPRFEEYVASLEDFKKNHFNRLSPEAEAVVRKRWRESFEAFGYA
ncbi:hypothetical protein Agub_g9433 [Astrephomene gubernaculifera]|uniref:Sulfotransferase n=1 Tax=Astrephomene gubernaculifera TaxID=47775 RepID=A0AAD3DTB0_9CHLO|nr:hypothetical protein Agub_g9433 [Astrephomene gubernaculifera]